MASQESWKMGEEGTGSRQSQVPDRPIHCLNNCGFFGSAATMNLCSKCYKELTLSSSSLLASKAPATEPAAANNIEAASITVASSSKSMKIENKKPTTPIIEPASSSASSKSIKIEAEGGSCEESGGGRVRKSKETDVLEEEEEEPRRRNKNRCYSCNKRVGLTGFKCRCGDLFCAQHRYSDMHNCTFDYKTAGRLAIQMANPVVKAPKIHKI